MHRREITGAPAVERGGRGVVRIEQFLKLGPCGVGLGPGGGDGLGGQVSAVPQDSGIIEPPLAVAHSGTGLESVVDPCARNAPAAVQLTMDERGLARLDYQPSLSFPPQDHRMVTLKSTAEATVVKLRNSRRPPVEMRSDFIDDRMLLVKIEAGSMAQRRALFNVDLRQIRGKAIESARLNLNLVPSGLGFSAYLPDTITFAVYGIMDERLEKWPTGTLKWEDAPGYVARNDVALNPSKVTLLGRFEIERGRQRGTCSIATDELRKFLNSDTSGIAGFVLVRETYGTSNYSLVHAFASSRHPEASGPSLEVMLADD